VNVLIHFISVLKHTYFIDANVYNIHEKVGVYMSKGCGL